MQLALAHGRRFRPCVDGCGAAVMVVKAPRDAHGAPGSWMPVEIIGFDESTNKKIVAIHHDLCVNQRIPGDRDPSRSHRIAVFEDQPSVPEDQARFRLRPVEG